MQIEMAAKDAQGRSGLNTLQERSDDPNRPYYIRHCSCIGVCMDILDAEPEQEKGYGLKRFFMMDLTDRLYESFLENELHELRGDLDRRGFFPGMVIEGFHKGITIVWGFDDVEALETLWRQYKSGELGQLLHTLFITDALLKRMGVKFIELRTRMWEDEYVKCRSELTSGLPGRLALSQSRYDLQMARRVKLFQKDFTREVHGIRDEWNMFELNLVEFKKNFKACIPDNAAEIQNLKQLHGFIRAAVKRNAVPDVTVINDLEDLLKVVRGTLDDIEFRIICPLLQIHRHCETDGQHEVKKSIKEMGRVARERMGDEYPLPELKHPDWLKKIKEVDHALLLGIISCIAYGVDAIMDVDQLLDEYCSAIDLEEQPLLEND